jgi:hypothetical protein
MRTRMRLMLTKREAHRLAAGNRETVVVTDETTTSHAATRMPEAALCLTRSRALSRTDHPRRDGVGG